MANVINKNETGVDFADVLYALQQRNLVYNGDFRYYSNRIINGNTIEYGIPDGWQYNDPGRNGKVTFDPVTNRCIIVKSEDESLMTFRQALHEFPRWQQMLQGQIVTARVVLSIGSDKEVTVSLTDGIDSSSSTKRGKGEFEYEVHLKINDNAASLHISIECTQPFVNIAIANVSANVGNVVINTLPCIVQGVIGERKQYVSMETPPAEELSLCNPVIELGIEYSRLDSVLNRRFGAGSNNRSFLPDMRGYFSRSWNNNADIDPDAGQRTALGGSISGDHVGTVENDEFLKHDHSLTFSTNKPILAGDKAAATIINTTETSATKPAGGKETRPKNIAELFTIKWA